MTTPTISAVQWVGELAVRSNGRVVLPTQVFAGQPIELCAQTYPIGAATRAELAWRTPGSEEQRTPMTVDAHHVGPFGNNTRWCAALPPLVADAMIDTRVIAQDAAGASVEASLAFTPRTEIVLFDGAAEQLALWRMVGNGAFTVEGDVLRAQPAEGLGLYWAAIPTPPDFELSLEWQLARFDDNSGVFIRFRDPEAFGYDNAAWVGVHDGLEIQIDDTARPDGADVHRTGAVYEQLGSYVAPPVHPVGTWRRFVIRVTGARVVVTLDGAQVSDVTFPGDAVRPRRALPSAPGAPRFIGLQSHSGTPAFRNIRLRAL